jgi:hypothetical protein
MKTNLLIKEIPVQRVIALTEQSHRDFDLARFNEEYQRGEWFSILDASRLIDSSREWIRSNYTRSKIPMLRIGNNCFFHISWLAERWPECDGALAWKAGPGAYAAWVQVNLSKRKPD